MKRSFIASIVTLAFAINAHANTIKTDDICQKIPGHWHGFFTLSNPEDCKRLNGCTHLISAEARNVSEHEYAILLQPAVGRGGEFMIGCENGVITPNKITLSCSDDHCFVVYSDPLVTSEMMKD